MCYTSPIHVLHAYDVSPQKTLKLRMFLIVVHSIVQDFNQMNKIYWEL